MNALKRSTAFLFAILLIFISAFDCRYFSYADTTTDNWQNVTTNEELVEAFQYYCKSRDLTIEGSVADGVTSFTTQTFNNICNAIGIDQTALQAHLKKLTDGNNIKYLFDSTGITAYNQIFAQFLQDNELEEGDEDVNKNVYNGASIQIGNATYLLYIFRGTNSNNCTALGTPFIYNSEQVLSLRQTTNNYFTYNNETYNANIIYGVNINNQTQIYVQNKLIKPNNSSNFGYIMYSNDRGSTFRTSGHPAFGYNTATSKICYGSYYDYNNDSSPSYTNSFQTLYTLPDVNNNYNQYHNNVSINLVSNVINNNTYEGDTIINNNGEPEGDDNPVNPLPDDNPYDDPDPTPSTPDGDDWDIDLPDLDINWILTGKEKKFPFDIPFNVMFALSLLNAEPETPHIEGTLNFGFTEWDYELDLSEFDDLAEICRNFEFLAFLIGLMLMTKRLIWG